MSYISDDAMQALIDASEHYLKPELPEEPLYSDPLNLKYEEFASILRSKGWDDTDFNTDEEFVIGYLFSSPERAKYADFLDEELPAFLETRNQSGPTGLELLTKPYEEPLANLLAAVPNMFLNTISAKDRMISNWKNFDWKELGNYIFTPPDPNSTELGKLADLGKKVKSLYDEADVRRAEEWNKTAELAKTDPTIALLHPKQTIYSIAEKVFSKHTNDVFTKQLEDPRNLAYWKYVQELHDESFGEIWQSKGVGGWAAYLNAAIASTALPIATGLGVGLATKNPALAINAGSALAFGLEYSDEFKQGFEYWKDQGYTPQMAARLTHNNALMYGAIATAFERFQLTRFIPRGTTNKLKVKVWNELTQKVKEKVPLSIHIPKKGVKLTKGGARYLGTITSEVATENMQLLFQYGTQYGYTGEFNWEDFKRESEITTEMTITATAALGPLMGRVRTLSEKQEEAVERKYKTTERKEARSPESVLASIMEPEQVDLTEDQQSAVATLGDRALKNPGMILEALDKGGEDALKNIGVSKETFLKEINDFISPEVALQARNILDGPEVPVEEETSVKAPIRPEKAQPKVKKGVPSAQFGTAADFIQPGEEQEVDLPETQAPVEGELVYADPAEVFAEKVPEPTKLEVAPAEVERVDIEFEEDPSAGYRERTKRNASADATIAIAVDFNSAGEKLTKRMVKEQKKKYIPIDASSLDVTPERVEKMVDLLNEVGAKTLNIAGNGIYTMKGKYTQEEVDKFTYDLLKAVTEHPNLENKIESIRTGGQTGFDEAGAKAGQRLGISTKVLAPKGWKFRPEDGKDVSDRTAFMARFEPTKEAPAEMQVIGGIGTKVLNMPETTISKIVDLLLEERAVGMAVPERAGEIRAILSGFEEPGGPTPADPDFASKEEIALDKELKVLFPSQKSRDKAIEFIDNTFITDKDKQDADAYSLGEIIEVIEDMTSRQREIGLMSKMSKKELAAYKAEKQRDKMKAVKATIISPEDLEADFQSLAKKGRLPLITEQPELANKVIASIREKYPEVETMVRSTIVDAEGIEQAGISIGAVAAWSSKGATLDTAPHEHAHVFIRALRKDGDKTILKGIQQFKEGDMTDRQAEESLVQYMGEYFTTGTIKGKPKGFISKVKTAARKIWARIKKVFGKPAEYIAQEFFERGKTFQDVDIQADKATRDKAKIEAIQAKYQTKIVGTTLKSIGNLDKIVSKKPITINDAFINTIGKGTKKAEKQFINAVIEAEGLQGQKVSKEEFTSAMMKHVFPITIERAGLPEKAGIDEMGYPLRAGTLEDIPIGTPTKFYGPEGMGLVAEGGVNYGEYNIKVPFEVPLDVHDFTDKNTFAWFRADEDATDPTTLRVNEVQSHLLQKSQYRDRETLLAMPAEKLPAAEVKKLEQQNEALKGLRDSDWEAYLTNSIIQWAAGQGYNKVRFPTGKTVDIIEKYDDVFLEPEDISELETRLVTIHTEINQIRSQGLDLNQLIPLADEKDEIENLIHGVGIQENIERIRKRYADLAKYLKKTRKDNFQEVTDEHGQTWVETVLMPEDADRDVPMYQPLSPGSQMHKDAELLIDNAFEGMKQETGKKVPLAEFVNRMSDVLPEQFYGVMTTWLDKVKKKYPKIKMKTMAEAAEGKDSGYFTTPEEFEHTFENEINELNEGLGGLDPNDRHISAKNGIDLEQIFMSQLGIDIPAPRFADLMNAATQEDFDTWSSTTFLQKSKRSYRALSPVHKQAVKRLWVQANSAIRVNTGTLKPQRPHLIYNYSHNALSPKGIENPKSGETYPQRVNKFLYEATGKPLKSKIIWLNESDMYEEVDSNVKLDQYTYAKEWQRKNEPMSEEDFLAMDKEAQKMIFEDDNIHGMVMMAGRGDANSIMFAAIRQEHIDIARDPAKLKKYWQSLKKQGLTPQQYMQLIGYRKDKDGNWKATKNATSIKWLAGEIARIEALMDLMPLSLINKGSELFRRIKIATTPIFHSPAMRDFNAMLYDPAEMIFEDKDGNEAKGMEFIIGMQKESNRADGGSFTSQSLFNAMHDAFGTSIKQTIAKTVIWKADLSLAVKHQHALPPTGIKMYKVDKKGNRILFAEVDDKGIIKLADGTEVDMLMTTDEAKISDHKLYDKIDIAGNELGLIKYHRKKAPSAKHPHQWYNYVPTERINRMFKENILPKLDRWLNKINLVTQSKGVNPKLIEKMLKVLQSDSPFAVSNSLVNKSELGLGLHADGEPMLNILLKTQIIEPALQLSHMKGAFLDVAPDWSGRMKNDEVGIAHQDAEGVLRAFANANNITYKQAQNVPVDKINTWLKDNPVSAIISRSPIPYVGGIYVGRVTELHDRGGQIVLNTETAVKRLESDWDGDEVHIEFADTEIMSAIEAELLVAETSNRMPTMDMSIYPSTSDQYQDLSIRENSFVLASKFAQGKRAIGEIANVQNVYGQLQNIFNYAVIDGEYIRLAPAGYTFNFPEAGEKGLTLEQVYRRWLQAAADNGKLLLLDDWNYSQERLMRAMFLRQDAEGKILGPVTDAQWKTLQSLSAVHKIPGRIRNGKTYDKNYQLDSILMESVLYKQYVDNRQAFLMKKVNKRRSFDEGVAELQGIFFHDTTAPLEDIAIALARNWEQNFERGKVTPVRFEDDIYKAVHMQAMNDLEEDALDMIEEALHNDIDTYPAISSEGDLQKLRDDGQTFAQEMWEDYTKLIQEFKTGIGPMSWDRNAELIKFVHKWNADYQALTETGQVVATFQFLRNTVSFINEPDATKGNETRVVFGRNKKALPPASKRIEETLLHPGVMEKYLKNYNDRIMDVEKRTQMQGVFGKNESFETMIRDLCS